jgi:hypothetical protein
MLSPAVLLLCALMCHPAGARNVALLVAVGQFGDPTLKTAQLLGPAIDIDSMQRALTERWGFQPGDVVALRAIKKPPASIFSIKSRHWSSAARRAIPCSF